MIYDNSQLANKNTISQLIINQAAFARKIGDLMINIYTLNIENLKLLNINDLLQSKLIGKNTLM